ncbi:hypothetical protein PAF17_18975 [Paracoccus sp. Z330]|uniref:Uncharacterized protein n=1 Tax=Paracoccus onchidii TaxID=3017813 RepID=A0ABT4ZKN1_9RHOB|nr:hypothetical protein [Paracoccus onchidii]MDB6179558.1 hypothetical protein [Paracoccus onchidii]
MDRLGRQLCAALEGRLKGRTVYVPDAGAELLDAFLALSRARSCGPNGPNPITWEAIDAWSRVMRVPILPRHAETIMAMDAVWMAHAMQRTPEGVKTLPPMSEHSLTTGALDAMIG